MVSEMLDYESRNTFLGRIQKLKLTTNSGCPRGDFNLHTGHERLHTAP